MGQHSRPIRLLTLTTLFPNRCQPRHGIFVANRLRRLCATGRLEATVVAAIPSFPGAYRESAAAAATEYVAGFDVHHPRYINIPGIGMRLQPRFLAHALLGELRNGGMAGAEFDAIDAHYFYPDGVAAVRVAHELDLPLVITARGSDINLIGDIPFARERMVEAANRAQALIAVSAALARKMVQLGMPADRIHILRNGVDGEMFAPFPKVEARNRIVLDNRYRWIAGVGNLVPDKGFDLLIRAVSMLDDVRLLIVGDGPLRGSLQTLARSTTPGRVEFRGNMAQPELRYVYAAADVLAVPSLREGWPNVVLEALACGTPVVASAVGGIPEILREDAPARMVRDRTSVAWRDALKHVLNAPLPVDVVRRYALEFGWDEVIGRQCGVYESMVTSGRPPTESTAS